MVAAGRKGGNVKVSLELLVERPRDGRIFLLTGPNGSGKTRALAKITESALAGAAISAKSCKRVICLSGTVLDKFPINQDGARYAYFGRRTNSNMFSEVAPYRRLAEFLMTDCADWSARAEVARKLLESISLGHLVYFKFRRGRNTKELLSRTSSENLDIAIDLSQSFSEQRGCKTRVKQLSQGQVHVSGVSFAKGGQRFDIADLSSGERSYALSILATAFSVVDDSVVIYDEPENSLHPKWQESIVRDMWQTISDVSERSSLVIATHSPLIVAGAKNRLTYVLDLDAGETWTESDLFGNTSDTVLKEQFGLTSPRSVLFLSRIGVCLRAMIELERDPQPFIDSADELLAMSVQLDREDPLFQTMEGIREARRSLQ